MTDKEAESWSGLISEHEHHVGLLYNFGGVPVAKCENCTTQKQQGTLSSAQLPLTVQLLRRAQDPNKKDIDNLGHDAVQNYLKDNLHWKAMTVSVIHRMVTIADDVFAEQRQSH